MSRSAIVISAQQGPGRAGAPPWTGPRSCSTPTSRCCMSSPTSSMPISIGTPRPTSACMQLKARGCSSRPMVTCHTARATTWSYTGTSCIAGSSTRRPGPPSSWCSRAGATSAGPEGIAMSSASCSRARPTPSATSVVPPSFAPMTRRAISACSSSSTTPSTN